MTSSSSTKRIFFVLLAFLVQLTLSSQSKQDAFDWPKELKAKDNSSITLYQPQLESMNGNILEGRMAITIKPRKQDMIFGAIWFKATLSTNIDARIVTLEKMDITRSHFPDIMDNEKVSQFARMLEGEMESWNLEMDMDRLAASLEEVENLKQLSDQFKNDPPNIYFRTTPTVLLLIDGDPIYKEDEKSGLECVVNTTFFIVRDGKKYYVKGGNFWYMSDQVLEGWQHVSRVPSKVEKFAADNLVKDEEADEPLVTEAPDLIVDTQPAELIVVDGKIDYKPIKGTELLYVDNTENDVILDISTQQHYVLIGGRWFYSKSLEDGDWKFREPKDLPPGFEKIPEDSDMTTVRASIPGTPEAETALLEQSIPQTATIDRKTATVEVNYDGSPEFEKIDGTGMSYARNTDHSVLLIDGSYYCVDNAVWFVSDSPTGPWLVSDYRPEEVNDLPPETPVYNVKYTYVYDSTPEVVYVGYLPGYTYSYIYNGVVVYGTGYYYRPWYRYYYYPRPVTFGFGVHWNPWTGWGFSFGMSWGWMSWGFHPYRYGYWGARGYHHGYRHGYMHGYYAGKRDAYRRGSYPSTRDAASRNVYNRRRDGVASTRDRTRDVNSKARPSNRANNIYTDRNGNVYQRDKQGNFDRKTNAQRPATRPSTQPSTRPAQRPTTQPSQRPAQRPTTQPSQRPAQRPTTQPSQRPAQQPSSNQNLNRSYQSRSRGAQNYNKAQSSGTRSPSRGSTGRRR